MKNFSEKILVQKLDKILRKKFGTNLAFKEFSTGYGIADLVLAPHFSFSKKKINRMPVTNFHALKILLSFDDQQNFTLDEILSLGNEFDKNILLKQLKFLLRNKYIEKISENLYRKILDGQNLNPIQKVVAIEVKLADHKGGLTQAKRYQYFADESYLAILKDAEKNINTEEFDRQNIGLILFDEKTDTIEIRYPQQIRTCESKLNIYAKELMIEKYLNLSF